MIARGKLGPPVAHELAQRDPSARERVAERGERGAHIEEVGLAPTHQNRVACPLELLQRGEAADDPNVAG